MLTPVGLATRPSILTEGWVRPWGLAPSPSGLPTPFCGNGVIDVGEACDPASPEASGGCSESCTVNQDHDCGGRISACRRMAGSNALVGTLATILSSSVPISVISGLVDCPGSRQSDRVIIGVGHPIIDGGCLRDLAETHLVLSGVNLDATAGTVVIGSSGSLVFADGRFFGTQSLVTGAGKFHAIGARLLAPAGQEIVVSADECTIDNSLIRGERTGCSVHASTQQLQGDEVAFFNRVGTGVESTVPGTISSEGTLASRARQVELDDEVVVDSGSVTDLAFPYAFDVNFRVRGAGRHWFLGAEIIRPAPLPPGAGATLDPHELRNGLDLALLRQANATHVARLTTDIASPAAFSGFATYAGIFDGQGKAMNVQRACDGECAGFADSLSGTLRNVTIAGTVTGTTRAAGLVMSCVGGTIGTGGNDTEETVTFKGSVTATSASSRAIGLVGTVGTGCSVFRARVGGRSSITASANDSFASGAFQTVQADATIVDNIVVGTRGGPVEINTLRPGALYTGVHEGTSKNIELHGPTAGLAIILQSGGACGLAAVQRRGGAGAELDVAGCNVGTIGVRGGTETAAQMGGIPWRDGDDGVATLLP